MTGLTLEVDLDLSLEPEDMERYAAYIEAGASRRDAAVQVAQDILGSMGAIVQYANAVRS